MYFVYLIAFCAIWENFLVDTNPTESRIPAKKFQNALFQQSLQTVLTSIEERLRNLDNVYSMQYSPSVEGRLELYGRKLESVEAKIGRLEAVMSSELDKIVENISARGFKDDIANDHVIRKIDSAYDRISHRLMFAEGKADMTEKKLENKLSMILSKLEKMEDSFVTRDNDIQSELADVIGTVEDVKIQCDDIEDKLDNITKTIVGIKNVETNAIQKDSIYHILTHKNMTYDINKEIKQNFEILSNKIVDFHDSSWKTYDRLENTLRSMSLVSNQSRYEVQSGLRALTIEVGRLAGGHLLGDASKSTEKLNELERKIDSNFESVIFSQNVFMESCYRVQKDEAQLETKISEILEKLLDTFAQKTTIEPKDIRRIEQILKNHDQYMRKANTDLVKTAASLLQKDYNFDKKFDDGIAFLRTTIENLYTLVNEQSTFDGIVDKIDEVITTLKDLQSLSFDMNGNIKNLFRDARLLNSDDFQKIMQKVEDLTKNHEVTQENQENLKKAIAEIHRLLLAASLREENSLNITATTEKSVTTETATIDNFRTTEIASTRDPVIEQLINDIFFKNDSSYIFGTTSKTNVTSLPPTITTTETGVIVYPEIDIRSEDINARNLSNVERENQTNITQIDKKSIGAGENEEIISTESDVSSSEVITQEYEANTTETENVEESMS